jgi:HK97 family phage prohead protease
MTLGVQRSTLLRLAAAPLVSTRTEDDRTIDYIFSDESVARDGHTIATSGWVLDNYLKNPVFLWAHDSTAPPIGRVVRIGAEGGQLTGTVRYAGADEYPFADTIFRLTKGGFLNAASVSWKPIDWRHATDKSRPGGIDFKRQELLEVSAVPVPALASALVTARGAGIDTKPLFDWAERALDLGGFAVLPREELERLRREAKMPAGQRAPAPGVEEPTPPVRETPVEPAVIVPPKLTKRSLWHVGWLAMLLDDLGCLQKASEYEAAIEEDNSPVPGQFLEALKTLGQVLVAMTIEEVTELLAGEDEEDLSGDVMAMASPLDLKRSAFRTLRRVEPAILPGLITVMREIAAGNTLTIRNQLGVPLLRAGKVLSKENERCLRDALELHGRACDMVRSVCDKNKDDEDPEEDDDDPDADDRALRARKAAARKRKLSLAV